METEKQRAEKQEREKLEKLKEMLHEQSEKDRERIEYRSRLLVQKRDEITSKKQAKKLENEEKEKKLENFFDKVKPKVEVDPIRAISFTEVISTKLFFFTEIYFCNYLDILNNFRMP